jgi:photosystem II stability/assembly factor-like uncharacterized protein
MTDKKIFLALNGKGLARAEKVNGSWQVDHSLEGMKVNCMVVDPFDTQRIYAGTQENGIQLSEDHGRTWRLLSSVGLPVKSLAVSSQTPGTIFAGCNPVSLFVSRDGGVSWEELEGLRRRRRWWWFSPGDPPGLTPYVQALALSPTDSNVMLAGIELGGVLRSEDAGQTWSSHRRGAVLDCHSLKFHHTDGDWIYEGGGSGVGAAFSRDGGVTWHQQKVGLGRKYGWMVAADPARPEVWYLSASAQPNLLRGEFTPPAHRDGQARAHIYRSTGGAAWEKLSGGLPQPLDHMVYALVTDPSAPGHLYAGLSNGEVWHTSDYGDNWEKMSLKFKGIWPALLVLPADL